MTEADNLLAEMNKVLVLHQDAEDVFEDTATSAEQKLVLLRAKHDELGGLLRAVLPE